MTFAVFVSAARRARRAYHLVPRDSLLFRRAWKEKTENLCLAGWYQLSTSFHPLHNTKPLQLLVIYRPFSLVFLGSDLFNIDNPLVLLALDWRNWNVIGWWKGARACLSVLCHILRHNEKQFFFSKSGDFLIKNHMNINWDLFYLAHISGKKEKDDDKMVSIF